MDKVKEIFNTIVSWVDTKGFTALASLGVGVGLWVFGFKVYAGIAFGVFLTRNWDILRGLLKK
jgi:predicted small integral membrane protein